MRLSTIDRFNSDMAAVNIDMWIAIGKSGQYYLSYEYSDGEIFRWKIKNDENIDFDTIKSILKSISSSLLKNIESYENYLKNGGKWELTSGFVSKPR